MANGKNNGKKVDIDALVDEKITLEDLRDHLEEEYRKAEISESNYGELSEKYRRRLAEIDAILTPAGPKKPEPKSQPEEPQPQGEETEEADAKGPGGKEEAEPEEPAEEPKEGPKKEERQDKPKKPGLFSRLLSKKDKPDGGDGGKDKKKVDESKQPNEEQEIDLGGLDPSSPEAIEKLAAAAARQGGAEPSPDDQSASEAPSDSGTPKDIEIEKLKVMLDTVRESGRGLEDSIRDLAEGVGEIRSMVFQTDGSLKETASKMEKIEDDISEVKPKEIDSRLRQMASKLEQDDLQIEKLQKKSDDLSERTNKVYEMMKTIGGVENLTSIDKDIQSKINDMKEALKYTERLALKTEKMFIDLTRQTQDIVLLKAKQEGLDETVRDILKAVDGINVKLSEVPTRKDIDDARSDILLVQKQMDEVNKVLPLAQTKMPETISALRAERGNVMLFMDSLKEHFRSGVITSVEYEEARMKNLQKLHRIDEQLKDEWKSLRDMVSSGALPKESAETPQAQAEEGSKPEEAPQEGASPDAPPADKSQTDGKPGAEVEGGADETPADEKPKKPKRSRKKRAEQSDGGADAQSSQVAAQEPTKESGSGEERTAPAQEPAAEKPQKTEMGVQPADAAQGTVGDTGAPGAEGPAQPQETPDQKQGEPKVDFVRRAVERLQSVKAMNERASAAAAPIRQRPSLDLDDARPDEDAEGPAKDDMSDVLRRVREKMR